MSHVTVDEMKEQLRVRHSQDDGIILRLIDAAEDEVLQFLNRRQLPMQDLNPSDGSETNATGPTSLAPSIRKAIYVLVDMSYNSHDPKDLAVLREHADTLMWPYRQELGV